MHKITFYLIGILSVNLSYSQTDLWVNYSNNYSTNLIRQDCGGYWFIHSYGFSYYDTLTRELTEYNDVNVDGLDGINFSDFEIDNLGAKWLVNNGELFRFSNGVVTKIETPEIVTYLSLDPMVIDENNNVWFYAGELYRYNYYRNELVTIDLGDASFLGIVKSANGTIYISVHNGLGNIEVFKYQFAELISIAQFQYTIEGLFSDFFVDSRESIWFTKDFLDQTSEGGLIYYHDGITREYHGWEFGLSLYGYKSFIIDSEGTAYLGAVENYTNTKLIRVYFDFESGDILNYDLKLTDTYWYYLDGDENFWHRKDGILEKISKNGVSEMVNVRSIPLTSKSYYSQNFGKDGSYWVESDDVVHHLKDDVWTSYTSEDIGILSGSISFIFNDSKDRTWIGTTAGVYYLENDNWSYLEEMDDYIDKHVQYITEDIDTNIFILTNQHLYKYEEEEIIEYTVPDIFEQSNDTYDKVISFKDRLVILGESVIYMRDTMGWNIFTLDDPIVSEYDVIFDFDVDSNGTVYFLADHSYTSIFKIEDYQIEEEMILPGNTIENMAINRNTQEIWLSCYTTNDHLKRLRISDHYLEIYNEDNSPLNSTGPIIIDHNNNNMAVGSYNILLFNPDGVEIFTDEPQIIADHLPGYCKSIDDPDQQLLFSPNPADELINVYLYGQVNQAYQINLFDILGRNIINKTGSILNIELNSEKLDISTISPGCYFLVATIDGKKFSNKIIIL